MNRDLIERLNQIANRAYEEASDIETGSDPRTEALIQAFINQFDEMSFITFELLNPDQEINPTAI